MNSLIIRDGDFYHSQGMRGMVQNINQFIKLFAYIANK